ncbi:hypothetical protein [Rhodoferax sp.]|uniref:hypothetical protein n=1 Tax=Rhodoferax sp. TaxID=50421 RepID=UPI00276D5F41|nr:replication initiation protein [Rhodoferax sp.]
MKTEVISGPDKIEKPVSALAMVPKTGAITRVGRQAYTVMMLVAREQGAEQGDTGMFAAPLNAVIRGFDGSKGTIEELKKHLRSMVTHVVEWQSPSPGEITEWGACALLAEVRLFKKNGENWLSWAYPPSLRQEMLSPIRYAQIRRSTIAQFRSHAGLALYEICARYKDNPSHLTSKQHWQWWLPVLTGKPLPKEIKTEFRFFNRDTIKPAVEEVNEVSELLVVAREIKVGRTVEFIQFEVRMKPGAAATESKPVDLTKVARALQLGIDAEIAEDLFIRFGELAFAKAIDRLEERLGLPGTPVLSRHAYLKSLLSGRVLDSTTAPQMADVSDGGHQAAAAAVVNPVERKHARLRESESERVKLVRGEIEALGEASLTALLDELKKQFQVRGMSQSVMQRLADGKWQSALVMGELIRLYWKQTRGTEWMAGEEALPVVEQIEQAGLF